MKNYNYFFIVVMVGLYAQLLIGADVVLVTQLNKLRGALRDLNTVFITLKPQEKLTKLDVAAFITQVKQFKRPIELVRRLFDEIGAVPFVARPYVTVKYVMNKAEQEEYDRLVKEFNDLLNKSERVADGAQWRSQLFNQLEDIQLEEVAKVPGKTTPVQDKYNQLVTKIAASPRAQDLYRTLLEELGELPPLEPREPLTPEAQNEKSEIKTLFGNIKAMPGFDAIRDYIAKELHKEVEKPAEELERELPSLPSEPIEAEPTEDEDDESIPSAPPLPEETREPKKERAETPEERTQRETIEKALADRRKAIAGEDDEEDEDEEEGEMEDFPTIEPSPGASTGAGSDGSVNPDVLSKATQEMLDRLKKEMFDIEEPEDEGGEVNRWGL